MERSIRQAPPEAELPLPELLKKLGAETTLLVRQEIALARAELVRTAKNAMQSAGAFGLCAIFALAAFGTLTVTVIAALALALPVWAAALIVTIVYAAIAAAGAAIGRQKLEKTRKELPEATVQTVKEDVGAVRAGVERGRRQH